MERKRAIVTGASRGIGYGIAACLAREGYDLAVSYTTKAEGAQALAEEVSKKYGAKCSCFQASLEKPGAGVELFSKCIQALGGLDLLVNNAGVTILENFLDLTPSSLEKMLNLDFINYLLMMQAAARYMVQNHVRGNIINITSSRGERAYPGDSIYGGLKAGLNRAVQSIALDLSPYGIRVNNVAPGAIRIRSKEEVAALGFGDFWEELGKRIPLNRSGEPKDIGEAVAFLASDRASYITGITLRVDGGLILPGMPEYLGPGDKAEGWGKSSSKFAKGCLKNNEKE